MGGRPERLYTPGVTLEIVPGYRIEVARASVRSGRKGAVEGVLHREESFKQPVELRADALPTGGRLRQHGDRGRGRRQVPARLRGIGRPSRPGTTTS